LYKQRAEVALLFYAGLLIKMYSVNRTKERKSKERKNVRTKDADGKLLSFFRWVFMRSVVFIRMNG
jgi:hypothetical protein